MTKEEWNTLKIEDHLTYIGPKSGTNNEIVTCFPYIVKKIIITIEEHEEKHQVWCIFPESAFTLMGSSPDKQLRTIASSGQIQYFQLTDSKKEIVIGSLPRLDLIDE